jgi:DNA-binding beta-propeller fold protein YncE
MSETEYLIQAGDHQFDPLQDNSQLGIELAPQSRSQQPGYFIIQFRKSLSRPEHDYFHTRYRLNLTDYIPQFAFLEKVTPETLAALSQEPLFRASTPYQPSFKFSASIGQRVYRTSERQALVGLLLRAILLPDANPQVVAEALVHEGAVDIKVIDDRNLGGVAQIQFILPSQELVSNIARLTDIRLIEEVAEQVEDNSDAATTIQSGTAGNGTIWDRGLHGENQIIGMMDSGPLDINHCFFEDLTNNTPGSTHRKVVQIRNASGSAAGGHATFVAGCAAGDEVNNSGAHADRGGAWAARLVSGNTQDLSSSSLLSELNAAATSGAFIHTNSWHDNTAGAGNPATYNQNSADVDTFTWNNEDHLVLGSAGNVGEEQGPPGTAKNAICVAAAQADPNENNFGDGNSGPTADGRRKPDLVAVGCGIESAIEGTTCGTGPRSPCATSYATPHAAAAAALVRQYYIEGWYPSGTKQPQQAFTPSGALLKATLLNSTIDMTGITDYPNNEEGWGLVQLDHVLFPADRSRQFAVVDVRNANGLNTGQSHTYSIRVTGDFQPLKVTLVWTEPPAQAGAATPVVNDLDLIVTSPDGTQTYLGNHFVNGVSALGGSADNLNNVEMVLVNNPMLGEWSVTIQATAVNVGNPGQGYALASSHDLVDSALLQACASLLLLESDRPASAPLTTVIQHYAGAIQAGTTTYGEIVLPVAAPPEGKLIQFTSSNPALVKIPNVIVPAKETSTPFLIQMTDNAANTTVTLTAKSDFTKQSSLSIPQRTIQTTSLGTKPDFNASVLGIATNGQYVYATHYYSKIDNVNESFGKGELVVIDSTTFKEVSGVRVALGFQPRSVAVNPVTKRIYATNYSQESYSLSILDCTDPTKPKPITELKLGQVPIDVAVNSTTNRIYITNPFQKKIHVINGETNTELQSIQLPSRPNGIAVDDKNNTLYVTLLDRNINPLVNAISIIKIMGESGEQTQTGIEVVPIYENSASPDPSRPTQPVDLAINLTTNMLYVANLGGVSIAPYVTVINLTTRATTNVKTISGARTITVNPNLNQVYIGTDSGVQILDGATNTIASTIPKKAPWGIAFNSVDNHIYGGSAGEGTLIQIAAPDLSTITQWT